MNIVGFDAGTMNLVSAKNLPDKKIEIRSMRNMFLSVEPGLITSSELSDSNLDYVEAKNEEGEIETVYILGEDAYRFSTIFGKSVRRPMSKGMISSREIDAIDVLTLMVDKLVGKTNDGYCIYSIPAVPIDVDGPSVLYHEKVFGRIFQVLGYKSKPINESMAIVFSECQKEKFSGIAISFGAGLTNVACSYKGTTTLAFSINRAGDWVDLNTAESIGVLPTRVTSVKERDLDLINPFTGSKKERRVREALTFYYTNLIDYVLDVFVKHFNTASEGLQVEESIPIVVSGGTSKPLGFLDLFKDVFSKKKDFPYKVSEIRQARDPLTAVATGCLIYALWEKKQDVKEEKQPEPVITQPEPEKPKEPVVVQNEENPENEKVPAN
jgi:hypothetical protein